jgi:protein-S-isoprenylcysteine O-methyltransferase Ste14
MAAQLPLLISHLPLRPSLLEIAVGGCLLVAGLVLNVWAERLFRGDNVGVCPFSHVPVLVARGPYRITRNPMYLGLVCANLSITLLTGVLANIWSSIAFCVWLHFAFVLPEEVFLRRELGRAFDEYARHVARWLSIKMAWRLARTVDSHP